jgi:DNA polymerase V
MAHIALLDCNNFFVSCERLFRPDLAHAPVLVLSSNDGCVISRSKEVKDLGIPMGMPYFKVRDELKRRGVVVFSSNITLYRDISERVMDTLASFGLSMEPYSIDEAFFILEGSASPEENARRVKERVEAWVGIPVSLGVGKSAVIAKYASEQAKKGSGVYVIEGGEAWERQMKDIHVGELWGVGRSTTRTCLSHGIKTAWDLAAADAAALKRILGVEGPRLKEALLGTVGIDAVTHTHKEDILTHVHSHESRKSIMSSRSFGNATKDKAIVLDALSYHVTHAAEKMRKNGDAALRMHVSIRPRRHGTFALHGASKEVIFDVPTFDTRVFVKEAKAALDVLFEDGVEYAKTGVVLGGFVPMEYISGSLFDTAEDLSRTKELMDTTDRINARFGPKTLRIGTTLKDALWKPRSLLRSPEYTTHWGSIPSVKAKNK